MCLKNYVIVLNDIRLILFIILNEFQTNLVKYPKTLNVFKLYNYFIPGKTSKKNMYQAINDAMDTVMSKDPNSGNFQYRLIFYNNILLYLYLLSSLFDLLNESQYIQFKLYVGK